MNEKIKQLAEQAGATVITTHGMEHVVDGCYVIGPARLEKFAESIVQECIVQIQLTTARDPQCTAQYKQSVGHIHRIRQHFGIE